MELKTWEKTVMSDKQLAQVEEAYVNEDFSVNFIGLGRGHTEDLMQRVAQAQAEISFKLGYNQALKDIKAGIKED